MVMFSYGSGLTATMFSLHLRDGKHPFSLENIATGMDVRRKLKSRHEVLFLFPETIIEIMFISSQCKSDEIIQQVLCR